MQEITIKDEFIKLGQALKLAGLVGSGVEAKVCAFCPRYAGGAETERP